MVLGSNGCGCARGSKESSSSWAIKSEVELVEEFKLVMLVVVVEAVLGVVDLLLELLALLVVEGTAAAIVAVGSAEDALENAAGHFVQERGRMRGRAIGGFAAGVSASRKPCGLVAGLVCSLWR
jgi:hypothetical protein